VTHRTFAPRHEAFDPYWGYQLTLFRRDSGIVASDVRAVRTAVRCIDRIGCASGLAAFALTDESVKLIVRGGLRWTGSLAQAIASGLKRKLALRVGFRRTLFGPILEEWHLAKVAPDVLSHSVASDPYWESNSTADLLGLRVLESTPFEGTSSEDLRPERLLPHWDGIRSARVTVSVLERHLVDAAAATAVAPDLWHRTADTARRAATHLAVEWMPATTAGALLRLGARSLRRVLEREPCPRVAAALERQLRARAYVDDQRSTLSFPE
jgi:hypothetical protein